jgi:hypothetical protein
MKHSIKREQSHARMSFAECENVRATLKHMKLSFHLILTLAAMLTMAQTAMATDVTWYMHGGKGTTCNKSGNQAEIISSEGETMLFTWTDGGTFYYYDSWSLFFNIIDHHLSVTFPYLSGTVTEVKLSRFDFQNSGMELSVGNGTTNLTTSGNQYFSSSEECEDVTVSFTGSIEVDADHPLRFTFHVPANAVESMPSVIPAESAAARILLFLIFHPPL